MISSVISWAIGPQIFLAAYERIRFHTSTTSWGILNGPGRWFRDTIGMAVETDRMGSLIWAIILGLTPMVLLGLRNATAGYLAESTYRGRLSALGVRWLTRIAYLVPVLFMIGLGYPGATAALFGSSWEMHWWQFWVAGLFCSAYYCTMWVFDRIEKLNQRLAAMSDEERAEAKTMGPGFFHALLMTPLASIVSGLLLYAPGAAW
jgi:ABC-type Mn2+/Zn2+ transport system permease subunit